MRRLSPHLAPLGYSPRRYLPLSPAPVLGMGERLTDLREMQLLFANGEQGGYWPADPAYAYEDSAGTTAASVNGVVGYRTDVALGKHAVQATTGNKPYLRRTPTSQKYWLDSNTATGALTATFASALGSTCTIATVGAEGVTILENQTIGTTYNLTPPYGYNGDVLIINRALTAVEKALVTRVLGRNVPRLGSDLITNGNFENGTTGFTARDAVLSSLDGGLGVTNSTTEYGGAYLGLTLIASNTYHAKVNIKRADSSGGGIEIGSGVFAPQYGIKASNSLVLTTLTIASRPTSNSVVITLWTYDGDGNNGKVTFFDELSVKAIL